MKFTEVRIEEIPMRKNADSNGKNQRFISSFLAAGISAAKIDAGKKCPKIFYANLATCIRQMGKQDVVKVIKRKDELFLIRLGG